ncbi:uncharacterized protein STEHIDRAFT_109177 [Stereum hirsutum FP-91666 SS1]|uniref:uncharacterized protein n=1 Tax=Stereum hirsutum (strain FP-91666) TaxID=721885 RepID=UPI000440BAE0|nr:uncharacterized protein STEHIDRAFT_109177 [Stereum hirsutum FP-91666 SS1]EIM88848.1 hypothetical protein STEHIDRAFT_109177 [Stereum hirsutum FP-91666 SS1]
MRSLDGYAALCQLPSSVVLKAIVDLNNECRSVLDPTRTLPPGSQTALTSVMSSSSDDTFGFELSQALTIQISAMIVETIIYGFYIGVFILSTWFTIRKGIWTRANQFMLTITSAMLMVASVHWGLSVRYTMLIVQTQSQRVSANHNSGPNCCPAELVLGDVYFERCGCGMESLAVVRKKGSPCYMHLSHFVGRKDVSFADQEPVPSPVTTVGEISLSLFNLAKLPSIWNYLLEQIVVERNFQLLDTLKVTTPVYIACSVTVLINIGATIVITYKAWVHRRLIREINQRDTIATKSPERSTA